MRLHWVLLPLFVPFLVACTSSSTAVGTPTSSNTPPLPVSKTDSLPHTPLPMSPTTHSTPALSPSPTPISIIALPSTPTHPDNSTQKLPINPANSVALTQTNQIQFNPWDLVLSLSWSPDGGILAVAAGEIIHLYDGNTFEEKQLLDAGVWSPSLSISPNSRRLVSGGRDGRVQFWDISTGENLFSIEAHKKGVNSVTFSPLGHLLASGGNDAVARLWDEETGQNLEQMIGGTFAVPAIAFMPDGASIAIVNGDVIRLRDVTSSRFISTIRGEVSFFSIDISPDGSTLAAGDSANTVTLWDITTGDLLHTLSTNFENQDQLQDLVWRVAFSPDGQILASAGSNATTNLWDVSTGELLRALTGHSKAVTSLAFSPDGCILATGSLDSSVQLWEVKP